MKVNEFTKSMYNTDPNRKESDLEDARKVALIFNSISVILSLSFFYFTAFYMLHLFLVLFIPVAAVYIVKKFNGLIKFTDKNKKFPNIILGLLCAFIIIAVSISKIYFLYSFLITWYVLVISSIFLVIIISVLKPKEYRLSSVLWFLYILIYSYSILMLCNISFDKSTPQSYYTEVLSKDFDFGGKMISTFHVTIGSWWNQPANKSHQVDLNFFDRVREGSKIEVVLKKGNLNIKWYGLKIPTNTATVDSNF